MTTSCLACWRECLELRTADGRWRTAVTGTPITHRTRNDWGQAEEECGVESGVVRFDPMQDADSRDETRVEMRREFGCGMRKGRVLERPRPSHRSPLTRHSHSAPPPAFLFCILHRVESRIPHSSSECCIEPTLTTPLSRPPHGMIRTGGSSGSV